MNRVIILAALVLVGCTNNDAAYVDRLKAFTVADLQTADKLAQQNGDTTAHGCWSALIPAAQTLQTLPPQVGAATALQVARDLTNLSGNIGRACAALAADTRQRAIGLFTSFGTSAIM